jgi:hypothetical protein
MNDELNQRLLDTLRELKDAVAPVVTDDDGMVETASRVVTGEDLDRLRNAWAQAVGVVGRIDRPAQYRDIPR